MLRELSRRRNDQTELLIDGQRQAGADRWVMRGTHLGEYQGIDATGNVLTVEGATFSAYGRDGQVLSATTYLDTPAFLRQLEFPETQPRW